MRNSLVTALALLAAMRNRADAAEMIVYDFGQTLWRSVQSMENTLIACVAILAVSRIITAAIERKKP